MGRGLGRLQRAILAIARDRHEHSPSDYVATREVLVRHYGFPAAVTPSEARNGAPLFDRRAIGLRRYMSASVAVAQCFGRLAARGLVERKYCYGVRLTRAGVKQARDMLV